MLPAETELHLHVNPSGSELTVNALVEEFERLEVELFATLLDGLQQKHLAAVRAGEAPSIRCPRCGSEQWVKRGSRTRRLKTSRGRYRFPLRQLTCKACGRTWSPFLKRLGLAPHQRTTEELRRQLTELATELSYQKASRWGERTLGTTLSPMTIWRSVQERGSAVEFTADSDAELRLEVDGTRLPVGPKTRGEAVHLAFAVGERRRAGPDPEEERLKAEVEAIIADHPAYGYRRIGPELEARTGEVINHKRLRRLLGEWDLSLKREVARPEPSGIRQILEEGSGELNLVADRNPEPLEMLSTDFTEIRYANGSRKAYLIAAVDPVSSWVPGWAVGPSPNRELALTAWQRVQESFRAVDRPLTGVVVHQDQDAVFTSYDWLKALLIDADVIGSYSENGAKGNPWIESLWGRFKEENASLIGTAETIPELREVIGDQMVYYNRDRRHSGIDYRSPVEFLRAEGRLPGSLSGN